MLWLLPLLTAPPHPKVLDQDTDAIAVHVVKVLTCIMSGSPSAKVRTLPLPAVEVWARSYSDPMAPELAWLVAIRAGELERFSSGHWVGMVISQSWNWISWVRAGWEKDTCGPSEVDTAPCPCQHSDPEAEPGEGSPGSCCLLQGFCVV